INYDIPDVPENYVHRCGRTGRGNKRGQALAFCSDLEQELFDAIVEYTGQDIEEYEVSKGEYLSILDGSDDGSNNWKLLLKKANEESDKGLDW
ncbi:MAG: ATP-dependent helicase, partial [Crocinitomicaceae bacterium]|nr:ATP-dependent helicase [Crocinitomicaceae bacterium]